MDTSRGSGVHLTSRHGTGFFETVGYMMYPVPCLEVNAIPAYQSTVSPQGQICHLHLV